MNYKQAFIQFMVQSDVLRIGDFTTKSGRKTPYFINTGNYRTGRQAHLLGSFYADNIEQTVKSPYDVFFGPAYKGIPLCLSAAIAMDQKYGRDIGYCFNRKETKDHGEGGSMIGQPLRDGDKVLIIEDVITAGTALRECLPILKAQADITVSGLIISVDRMERGQGEKSAIAEIYEEFGIVTYPIVTIHDIIDTLYDTPVNGKIYIDDAVKARMLNYLDTYGVR